MKQSELVEAPPVKLPLDLSPVAVLARLCEIDPDLVGRSRDEVQRALDRLRDSFPYPVGDKDRGPLASYRLRRLRIPMRKRATISGAAERGDRGLATDRGANALARHLAEAGGERRQDCQANKTSQVSDRLFGATRVIVRGRSVTPPTHFPVLNTCERNISWMRLVMGGINGHYLRNITENCARDTEEVLAAVAYATGASLLFDWCWQHRIPLRFYGRLDDSVAVSVPILATFLSRKSANFVCRLVQHHHAKVIWWRGVGAYIGSANLTDSAWYKNVEAGCFFPEAEINDEMANDLLDLFATLDAHAAPLTEELLEEMKRRSRALASAEPNSKSSSGQALALPSGLAWFKPDRRAPTTGSGRPSSKNGIPRCRISETLERELASQKIDPRG